MSELLSTHKDSARYVGEIRPCCVALLENEEGSCVFGCGSTVDMEHGMCRVCQDHSANELTCERCGAVWQDWHGWETPLAKYRELGAVAAEAARLETQVEADREKELRTLQLGNPVDVFMKEAK